MTKTAIVWISLAVAMGCGGASKRAPAYAPASVEAGSWGDQEYDAIAEERAYGARETEKYKSAEPAAPQPMKAQAISTSDSTGSFGGAPTSGMIEPTAGQAPGDERWRNKEEAPTDGFDAPMVVYLGFLKVRVKRLFDAVDEITEITEKMGGYIDSLTKYVIVVRIPAEDFDEVIAAFSKIGELLDSRIKAMDVSEQFTDLGARLAVAKEARERLLKLLEKTDDVEERLCILNEIKRLSEQIESIESKLATLKNLIDYFTITIELVPVLEDSGAEVRRSPFPWVRNLEAHLASIFDGKDDFSLKLPSDFVLFEKADEYLAQAADTTVIRGGVVDNEPRADNAFWSKALHHEMEGRGEKSIAEGKAGPMSYNIYRSEDIQPRYYLIAVSAHKKDLYVVEAFFPSEEAYKTHHEEMVEALSTFEVK
jgi:hypothetical protein